jgi:hypothetical protein
MLWNKKEAKSVLPDLPPLETPFKQELAEIQQIKEHETDESADPHMLPSFPDSLNSKGFSQTIIKDAVSNENEEDTEFVGNIPKNYKTVEMEDSSNSTSPSITQVRPAPHKEETTYPLSPESSQDLIPQIPIKNPIPPSLPPQMPLQKNKFMEQSVAPLPAHFSKPPVQEKYPHVFIKIDRFFSAKKALSETKDQLDQIEDLLKKIREVKLREEQELARWEHELLSIKSRVREVTQNIFEKVE